MSLINKIKESMKNHGLLYKGAILLTGGAMLFNTACSKVNPLMPHTYSITPTVSIMNVDEFLTKGDIIEATVEMNIKSIKDAKLVYKIKDIDGNDFYVTQTLGDLNAGSNGQVNISATAITNGYVYLIGKPISFSKKAALENDDVNVKIAEVSMSESDIGALVPQIMAKLDDIDDGQTGELYDLQYSDNSYANSSTEMYDIYACIANRNSGDKYNYLLIKVLGKKSEGADAQIYLSNNEPTPKTIHYDQKEINVGGTLTDLEGLSSLKKPKVIPINNEKTFKIESAVERDSGPGNPTSISREHFNQPRDVINYINALREAIKTFETLMDGQSYLNGGYSSKSMDTSLDNIIYNYKIKPFIITIDKQSKIAIKNNDERVEKAIYTLLTS